MGECRQQQAIISQCSWSYIIPSGLLPLATPLGVEIPRWEWGLGTRVYLGTTYARARCHLIYPSCACGRASWQNEIATLAVRAWLQQDALPGVVVSAEVLAILIPTSCTGLCGRVN